MYQIHGLNNNVEFQTHIDGFTYIWSPLDDGVIVSETDEVLVESVQEDWDETRVFFVHNDRLLEIAVPHPRIPKLDFLED